MKRNTATAMLMLLIIALAANFSTAQKLAGRLDKTISKIKDQKNKNEPEDKNSGTSQAQTGSDDSETRAENAKNLAKSAGMPNPANSDAALNKLLFQAADDVRLIPRRVVVVDKDWLITTGARNEKVRRIFAVVGRTLDDGSGKCGKQMVQFDQDWKEDKNAWGLIYVQNIGEITPIACSAIGK